MQPWKRFEGTILPTQFGGSRIECARVSVRPPIRQRTGPVVFLAIIIKTVDQLMADSGAEPAVVDRWISRRIEIRSLHLRAWHDHLIEGGTVISIHRPRR